MGNRREQVGLLDGGTLEVTPDFKTSEAPVILSEINQCSCFTLMCFAHCNFHQTLPKPSPPKPNRVIETSILHLYIFSSFIYNESFFSTWFLKAMCQFILLNKVYATLTCLRDLSVRLDVEMGPESK